MTAPTDYPLPTIHLNGTGKETLLREYYAAYKAAKIALDALQNTTCHARDYYVNPTGPYFKASEARAYHLRTLHDLIQYLGTHINHIADTPQVADGHPSDPTAPSR